MTKDRSQPSTPKKPKALHEGDEAPPPKPFDQLTPEQREAISQEAGRRAYKEWKRTGNHRVVVEVDGHWFRILLEDFKSVSKPRPKRRR